MVENAITASNRFHGTITASPGHGDTITASPASRTPHSQPFAAEIRRLLRHSRWHELRTTIYLWSWPFGWWFTSLHRSNQSYLDLPSFWSFSMALLASCLGGRQSERNDTLHGMYGSWVFIKWFISRTPALTAKRLNSQHSDLILFPWQRARRYRMQDVQAYQMRRSRIVYVHRMEIKTGWQSWMECLESFPLLSHSYGFFHIHPGMSRVYRKKIPHRISGETLWPLVCML